MGKELKEVEEEVNIVVEKIKKQAQHHAETTIRVRKVLLDYFLMSILLIRLQNPLIPITSYSTLTLFWSL